MNKFKMNRLSVAVCFALLAPLTPSVFAQSPQSPQSPQSVQSINESSKATNKINDRSYPEVGLTLPDASTITVYKYVDSKGRVHYTDSPPKQYQASAKVIDTKAKEGIASVRPVSQTSNIEPDWKLKDKEFRLRQEAKQKLEDELASVRAELRIKEASVKTEPTEEDYERFGRNARRLSPDFSVRQETLKNEIEELKNKEREIKDEISYPQKNKNNIVK